MTLKITEVQYFGWNKFNRKDNQLSVLEMSEDRCFRAGETKDYLVRRQEGLHIVRDCLDIVIVIEYWLLNYHKIMWR